MIKSYFDPSILLPVLIDSHPNHEKCLSLFQQAKKQGQVVSTTLHIYAELYSNITKLPHGLSIDPQAAMQAIIENLGKILVLIDLNRADYEAAIRRCAGKKLVNGVIYDALHFQAAIKAEVDFLYTSNLRDFERLYSNEVNFELVGV